MSQVNYNTMSDLELKVYFLKHREDKAAFQAYLDRINQQEREIIATLDDPDFDAKIQAAILQQIKTKGSRNKPVNQ